MRLVRARRFAKGSGLVSIHAVRIAAFLTTVGLVWGVAQSHPWLTPYVERSARDVALILDAATARNLDPGWVDAQLRLAVTARDRDRVALIAGLAERYDVPLDPALKAQADQVGEISVAQRVIVCGACAYDLNSCPGLADVVSCNLPVELTPLGDVNALRRGAADWWQDQPVDRFDVALASVGLAATGLAVASGGASVTVKIGASVLRVGRGLGRVNARLMHAVTQGADSAAGLRACASWRAIWRMCDSTRRWPIRWRCWRMWTMQATPPAWPASPRPPVPPRAGISRFWARAGSFARWSGSAGR